MDAITGGTVVDIDGARRADVALADGEIADVGDVDWSDALDASGAFVAPGLVDAHVHLTMDGGPDPAAYRQERPARKHVRAAGTARELLSSGVTAARDLGAADGAALAVRDAVEEGDLDGPRIRAAGRNVTMTGGHAAWFGREADGPDEVRKAAREQLKAGADVVKCMATGGVLTEGAKIGAPELTVPELEALVDAAAAKGVPTAAHAHGTEGIKNAVRAGITSVEHGTFMDAEAAELMAERGTYWVPTASALHGFDDVGPEDGVPEYAIQKAGQTTAAFDESFDHALSAGVTVAMGTDAGTPFNYHADAPTELEYLVEHGMSPEGALEAATVNAADLLGLDDHGRVAPGYAADLVVLDANPLEDPAAWQDPVAVVRNGRVVA